ncbi:MAG: fumarylacetoacetate hydrolase family protein [Alphaproteobacteria bacterium]|nr:fumarylacetoacetate hydrolase family protein [Alphaproteobacteria bacterium]
MKLVRYGPKGREKPGLVDPDGKLRDLSRHLYDTDHLALSEESLHKFCSIDPGILGKVEGTHRFGVPLRRVGKCVCIGLNYTDHAAETNSKPPKEPIIFMKATSSLCGPNDPIIVPKDSVKTDWEVELAVIIGRKTRHVSEDEALDCVAGYAIMNDVSEREFQIERGGQWVKGKSCDNFGPLGPWLVTRDDVPDPQVLELWLDVNGERMQTGSTANMIFSVRTIISYVSRFITLYPCDVISTGTPAGVGLGKKPPRFLKTGDVVTLGVSGLGQQRQECVAWSPST